LKAPNRAQRLCYSVGADVKVDVSHGRRFAGDTLVPTPETA
jgi:hypothetical protein